MLTGTGDRSFNTYFTALATALVCCVVAVLAGCSSGDGTSNGWAVGENNEQSQRDGAEAGSPCQVTLDCDGGLECRNTNRDAEDRRCAPIACQCEDGQWCSYDGTCVSGDYCDSDDDCAEDEHCLDSTGSCGADCTTTEECDGSLTCAPEFDSQGDTDRACGASTCPCLDERDVCHEGTCVREGINCTLDNCPDGYGCRNGQCECEGSLEECYRPCTSPSECTAQFNTTCSQNGYCEVQYCGDDSDCRGSRICGAGPEGAVCVTPGTRSIGDSCELSADCLSGACIEQTCVQRCTANSDCFGDRECVSQGEVAFCRATACGDCADDEFCAGSQCRRLCSATSDCADGELCMAPQDGPSFCTSESCPSDNRDEVEQCADHEVCFQRMGGCMEPCDSGSECIERFGCDNCSLGLGSMYCSNRRCEEVHFDR